MKHMILEAKNIYESKLEVKNFNPLVDKGNVFTWLHTIRVLENKYSCELDPLLVYQEAYPKAFINKTITTFTPLEREHEQRERREDRL
jgi:hypothetical protein